MVTKGNSLNKHFSTNRVTLHVEGWFKLANQKRLMSAVMQRPKVQFLS